MRAGIPNKVAVPTGELSSAAVLTRAEFRP